MNDSTQAPTSETEGSRGARSTRVSQPVRRCLDEVRRSWRATRVVEGGGLAIAALCAGVLGLFALDNLFHLSAGTRFALLAAAAAAVAAVAFRALVVRPSRAPDDDECALLVERCHRGLENRLINTIHLRRRDHSGLAAAAVEIVEAEAETRVAHVRRGRVVARRTAVRLAVLAAAAASAVALYASALPTHFRNAARRYANPFGDVSPITRTTLRVTPGDAEVPLGGSVVVRAETEGLLPEKAILRSSSGLDSAMTFDGRSFELRLDGLDSDISYQVLAGDARSPRYRVRVVRPPEVKALDVTVHPPAYSGLPPRVEKGSTGNIEALRGSTVVLDLEASRPLQTARIYRRGAEPADMERISSTAFRGSVELPEDVEYSFLLVDAEGVPSPEDGPRRTLRAVPDLPPECEVLDPAKDLDASIEAAGGIAAKVRVADDVGLARAELLVAPIRHRPTSRSEDGAAEAAAPADDAWSVRRTWSDIRGKQEAFLLASLDFRGLARPGEPVPVGLAFRAAAVDLRGSRTLSTTRTVRFVERKKALEKAAVALAAVEADLATVLRRERVLEGETSGLLEEDGAPGDGAEAEWRPRLERLGGEQLGIRNLLLAALARLDEAGRGVLEPGDTRPARAELGRVASDLMPDVALRLMAAGAASGRAARPHLERALSGEREIIAALERAIGSLSGRIAALRSDEEGRRTALARPPSGREASGKLRDLLEALQRFRSDQKEVLAWSRALDEKSPEDFTQADLDAMDELAATEERWGKLLEEKATDLSKVAPQDMSLGTVLEETVELVEEIDLAKDYLKGRNVELAVPVEQSGVALSETIETNIEKWLLRDRDRLKWVMEEPTGEFDVPLADLPSELEDIVGDLIDQEELMTEETEDITSSWLDSMDDGIGWDAMDGPISNMSAKGVTGNLQPNDMEIGGRSGEGRSGRSQGQMVEESASGKGGRQTPTRSTADPFEAGEVKDSSRDPTGGSTGGGKLSGAGPQGLRGPQSPELQRRLGALARNQVQIREQAEKLDLALRRRRYHAQDLDRAIELMKALEEHLAAGKRVHYEEIRKSIVSELRGLERSVAAEATERILEPRSLPAALQEDLLDAAGEEIPAEYADVIRDYYRSLGRGTGQAPGAEGGRAR